MALIIKKSDVVYCGDDWDEIENYPQGKRKLMPTEVLVWPVERSTIGYVMITYGDGAMCTFIGDTFSNLKNYLPTIEGWPEPIVYYKALPRVAQPFGENVQKSKPETKESISVHAVRRRRTVVESGPSKHVRRSRAAH